MAPQERNSLTCEEQVPATENATGSDESLPQVDNSSNPKASKSLPELKDSPESSRSKADISGHDKNNVNNVDKRGSLNTNLAFTNRAYESDPDDNRPSHRRTSFSQDNEVNFDDLLPFLGEFGKYQKILFLLMIPFTFYVCFVYFSQIFMTLTPEEFYCKIPALQNLTQEQIKSLLPVVNDKPAACVQYDVKWEDLLSGGSLPTPNPDWPQKKCTDGYEYSPDVPYPTITTELNWVCEDDGLVATAQAVFFCGAIVGGFLFGWVADKYGRIPALVGTNFVGFVAGVGTAFCHSFWSFCICRFFVGMAFDNCFTMMYILVLEYTGPKWRTFVANMSIAIFFTFASCLLPWIAYFIHDWRWFTVATSAPLLLAVATPWVVPESARWLVSQGRVDEAITILRKFERINKMKIPEKTLQDFRESCLRIHKEEETSGKTYSVLELFKTPRMRKVTILLIIIWMAIALVFDGHVRNVGSLGLDVFLTFTIASATELPADTFLTVVLDRWGRRWLACGSLVFSGVFSVIAAYVPLGIPTASFALIGRFAVNISYNIGLQYAAELLPTVVRAQGVALIHITGYIGSILAPFIVYLGNYNHSFPLLVLGIIGIVSGLLCLFLPETVDQDLPQTMQDGEDFGKDQRFWEAPCLGKKPVEDDHPGVYQKRRGSAASVMSHTSLTSTSFSRTGFMGFSGSRASVRTSMKESMRRRQQNNIS